MTATALRAQPYAADETDRIPGLLAKSERHDARSLQHCAGLIAGESERRLSGEGHHCARADHAAASRSSDGSDNTQPRAEIVAPRGRGM